MVNGELKGEKVSIRFIQKLVLMPTLRNSERGGRKKLGLSLL
jgi:hypothetical protein